jgi:radical SAM protein with 4Fe4S-binding SPASM domain
MTHQMTPKEVLEYYAKKGLPKDFCPVPFSTLIFEANGNVCMCRRKGNEFAIGDIRKQTYAEIWNGETLQGIRREFLEGKPVTCAKEIRRDKCNLAADNADLLDKIDISVVQTRPPIRLTPNFNGKCNIECKMCHVWQMPNGLYDEVGFWKVLEEEILPHLVEIDTFSGEPFIQKDTYRLFDLASRINPNILWRFTSNLNWKFNDHIRSHLDRLKIGTFAMSIDSFDPKTYAEIRRKGDLAKVMQTFDDLLAYDEERVAKGQTSLGLVLHSVIQLDNWRELPEILAVRRKTGVKLHLKYLAEPPAMSLDTFSAEKKAEVLDYYLDNIHGEELKMVASFIRPLLEGMAPLDRADRVMKYRDRVVL